MRGLRKSESLVLHVALKVVVPERAAGPPHIEIVSIERSRQVKSFSDEIFWQQRHRFYILSESMEIDDDLRPYRIRDLFPSSNDDLHGARRLSCHLAYASELFREHLRDHYRFAIFDPRNG
ncbi:hypothetical protein GOD01_03290 [Sinorhizobium medicae]|nr:hypothetical protein [Sinorhizobium medicae]